MSGDDVQGRMATTSGGGSRRSSRRKGRCRGRSGEAGSGKFGRRGGAGALLGRDSGVVEGRGRGGAGSAPSGENAEAALGFEAALQGGVWGPRGAGAK